MCAICLKKRKLRLYLVFSSYNSNILLGSRSPYSVFLIYFRSSATASVAPSVNSLDVASGKYYFYNVAVNFCALCVHTWIKYVLVTNAYNIKFFIRQCDYKFITIGLTVGNQSLTYTQPGVTSGYGKLVSDKLAALYKTIHKTISVS